MVWLSLAPCSGDRPEVSNWVGSFEDTNPEGSIFPPNNHRDSSELRSFNFDNWMFEVGANDDLSQEVTFLLRRTSELSASLAYQEDYVENWWESKQEWEQMRYKFSGAKSLGELSSKFIAWFPMATTHPAWTERSSILNLPQENKHKTTGRENLHPTTLN